MSAIWSTQMRPYFLLTRTAHYSLCPRTSPTLRSHSHSLALTRKSFKQPPPLLFQQQQQQQRCLSYSHPRLNRRQRPLLTLAIETSCDDTCVAVLEKHAGAAAARLRFDRKLTSDNREFHGVRPIVAVVSHSENLAAMVREAMRALPEVTPRRQGENADGDGDAIDDEDPSGLVRSAEAEEVLWVDGRARRKPDFVTVTRGPGMLSNLSTGLNTAKGLAVAWDVPLLGVNHMQAHALTPRLVGALAEWERMQQGPQQQQQRRAGDEQEGGATALLKGENVAVEPTPAFPFLSLLVSGGHTLLVLSRSLNDHAILAEARNIAIGDMLDKCARVILPESELAGSDNVMYGRLLERFAFPDAAAGEGYDYDYGYEPPPAPDKPRILDSGLGWFLTPPLSTTEMVYDLSGLNGQVQKVLHERPDTDVAGRRILARHTMRLAFEHLGSRLLLALSGGGSDDSQADGRQKRDNSDLGAIRTVVVAGGVASNRYLLHILRAMLDARGYGHVELVCPPLPLCTDNAAMIAWTGMEMYEAGWRSDLDVLSLRKWALDPGAEGGGILGASGWRREED
ncbi:Mitochondrial tRNAs modification protein [Parahypoxylon ruwenzoriense]